MPLVGKILGCSVEDSTHLATILLDQAKSVSKPDWCSISDLDVTLRQKHLSHSIDEVSYSKLVTVDANIRFNALTLSSAFPHVGD